jgi:hypothetical protein
MDVMCNAPVSEAAQHCPTLTPDDGRSTVRLKRTGAKARFKNRMVMSTSYSAAPSLTTEEPGKEGKWQKPHDERLQIAFGA